MKKKLLIIVVLGVVLLALWYSAGSRQKSSQTKNTISTATVTKTDFTSGINSSGKTYAKRQASVRFQTSGNLSWVGVTEGAVVKKYQALARLDSRDVESSLKNSLLNYAKQRNDFDEMKQVTYDNVSTQGAPTDTIKRILEKNQWDLEKSVADVELKHLSVEYAVLTSPMDGIVTSIENPIAGVNITPATSDITIIDPSSIMFRANIDETEVGKLAVGQKAIVSLDAYPDATQAGTVHFISYAAETSAGGATIFPVDIQLESGLPLRVGLNGDVTVLMQTEANSLVVPKEAVRDESGKKYVYKKVGKAYQKTNVEIGESNTTVIVVKKGLVTGDEVVTKGFSEITKL
jgi:RND family efflux transporter MFP subunit